jgi:hypothetical protein
MNVPGTGTASADERPDGGARHRGGEVVDD